MFFGIISIYLRDYSKEVSNIKLLSAAVFNYKFFHMLTYKEMNQK